MKKNQRIFILGFVSLALALGIGGLLIAYQTVEPQSSELQPLQLSDLSGEVQGEEGSYMSHTTISHPLHKDTSPDSPYATRTEAQERALYDYTNVYEFSGFMSDGPFYIANYIYTYPTETDAQEAVQVMVETLIDEGFRLVKQDVHSTKNADGQVLYAKGDIDDSIYWFVGANGDSLYLVLANGLAKEKQQQTANLFSEILGISL